MPLPVGEAFLFKGCGEMRFGVKSGLEDKKTKYCVATLVLFRVLALRKKRNSARLENTSPSADVF